MKKIRLILEEYSEQLKMLVIFLILFLTFIVLFLLAERKEKENYQEDFSIEGLIAEADKKDQPFNQLEDNEEPDLLEQVKSEKILVDLKGAVEFPGVYEMESGQRVIDCVNKGGGFLKDAEEKVVNLAQRIEDQMVIYIPTKGEELAVSEQLVTGANNLEAEDHPKIDLNTATKEELKSLNGIGDVKAENIINYRKTNGFFQKIEDIKNVSGIGELTFEKLKDELTVSP